MWLSKGKLLSFVSSFETHYQNLSAFIPQRVSKLRVSVGYCIQYNWIEYWIQYQPLTVSLDTLCGMHADKSK